MKQWRWQAKSFSELGLYGRATLTLTGHGEPERVRGARTTASMLPMLGVSPRLGRLHTEAEDELKKQIIAGRTLAG